MTTPLIHLIVAVLLAAVPVASAPSPDASPTPDPCGDARAVSQAYFSTEATVVEVRDSITLLVAPIQREGDLAMPECVRPPCLVRLVDLVPPPGSALNERATRSLADSIGSSKAVSILVSPKQDLAGVTNAIVMVGSRNLNEAQLRAGLASYRSAGPYSVDGYLSCRFRNAEEAAKRERLGMWPAP